MPHEQMSEQQLAAYLHMDLREVQKLASRGNIPCRKVGGRFVFGKGDIDHWVETRLHEMDSGRLVGIERGVCRHHGFAESAALISDLVPVGGLAVPLQAKTRDAAIRSLVNLADTAGLVFDRDALVLQIRNREEMCPTSLFPGVAIPHPRHPMPHCVASSFVVAGVTSSGIPFGAADGSLTRLFFLICSKDDRTHLHVLARLAQMLHDPAAIGELMDAPTAEELAARLHILELAALRHSARGE